MCFACSPFAGALAGAMSRRSLLKHTLAGAAWAGMAGATGGFVCSPAEAATESGDTLYVGGPIVTINDAQPTAEAVLVRAGKIVAVGTRAEVEKQAQGTIATVDLQGKALLPGFVDPHGHVVLVGLQALGANLLPAPDGDGNDIAALQRILREWMAKNGKIIERYRMIVAFGYDDSQLKEERHPTRADLDAVSTETPIMHHPSVRPFRGPEQQGARRSGGDEGYAQSAGRHFPPRGGRRHAERGLRGSRVLRRGRQNSQPARHGRLSRDDQSGRRVQLFLWLHDRPGRTRDAGQRRHARQGGRGRAARCRHRRLSRCLSVREGHYAHARLHQPRPHRRRKGGH